MPFIGGERVGERGRFRLEGKVGEERAPDPGRACARNRPAGGAAGTRPWRSAMFHARRPHP
jgi:hypothetical protein